MSCKSLIFTLMLLTGVNFSSEAISTPSSSAMAALFTMGIGARYLAKWLGEEVVNRPDIQEAAKALQLNPSHLKRAITTAELRVMKSALSASLIRARLTAETSSLLSAFTSGAFVPTTLSIIAREIGDTAPLVTNLSAQTAYASLDSLKIAMDAAYNAFYGIKHAYPDLHYPLTARGGVTAPMCGKNDPYCMAQEKRVDTNEFFSNPDQIALTISHLLSLTPQPVAAALMGYTTAFLSFSLGKELMPAFKEIIGLFLKEEQNSDLTHHYRTFIKKTVKDALEAGTSRYLILALSDRIYADTKQVLENLAHDKKETPIINQDSFFKPFLQGALARVLQAGIYPFHKTFFENLIGTYQESAEIADDSVTEGD